MDALRHNRNIYRIASLYVYRGLSWSLSQCNNDIVSLLISNVEKWEEVSRSSRECHIIMLKYRKIIQKATLKIHRWIYAGDRKKEQCEEFQVWKDKGDNICIVKLHRDEITLLLRYPSLVTLEAISSGEKSTWNPSANTSFPNSLIIRKDE